MYIKQLPHNLQNFTLSMNILIVIGSARGESVVATSAEFVAEQMRHHIATMQYTEPITVTTIDLRQTPLPMFTPKDFQRSDAYITLKPLVDAADVYVLATPDYHGSMSGTLKNFLDHFWEEFAGKMFGILCASNEKGLTVIDHVRTSIRQFYGWSLPYGASLSERDLSDDGTIVTPAVRKRLTMFARDMVVYGAALSTQRKADLANNDPATFMARYRPQPLTAQTVTV
jgi:FMN reductase